MDAEVKSHLAYTFKAPSLLDHANFIESLTCTIFTVIMTIAHLDSTPPPWISLVRISEELFTIFTFLAVISAIITIPRIIFWLLLPRLMNFLEKLFPILYILSVTCLSIHKDLNSLWSSYKFANNLRTVLESFAIGLGGFLTFKFFHLFKSRKIKATPGLISAFVFSLYIFIAWMTRSAVRLSDFD